MQIYDDNIVIVLQQLQAAVEKRNEIISQLSINLQAALMSRDQVQLEAQQLTGQIQELQLQLQQVMFGYKPHSRLILNSNLVVGLAGISEMHLKKKKKQNKQKP